MIEPTAVPVSPLPSYWEYETTRRSCARCGVDGAAHQNREQSARWWGPGGFTLEFFETDFRSSGGSRLWLRSSEGRDYWIEGVHLELAEPERIVFIGKAGQRNELLPELAGTVTFRRA